MEQILNNIAKHLIVKGIYFLNKMLQQLKAALICLSCCCLEISSNSDCMTFHCEVWTIVICHQAHVVQYASTLHYFAGLSYVTEPNP